MAASPTTGPNMRTFIIDTASLVMDEKVGDAVQILEREKDLQSKRIDSIESDLTTKIVTVIREFEEKIEAARQAVLAQLAEECSSAAAGVQTQIDGAKPEVGETLQKEVDGAETELEDPFGEQVTGVRGELKTSKQINKQLLAGLRGSDRAQIKYQHAAMSVFVGGKLSKI